MCKWGVDGYGAALGLTALSGGSHMITFRIDAARGNAGNMVLGVADSRAGLGGQVRGGASCAWGLHPFYGRIYESVSPGEVGAVLERSAEYRIRSKEGSLDSLRDRHEAGSSHMQVSVSVSVRVG